MSEEKSLEFDFRVGKIDEVGEEKLKACEYVQQTKFVPFTAS